MAYGTAGQRRGFCADCGAGRDLQDDGTMPDHPVYRVEWNRAGTFEPRAYPSDREEDLHCSGAGKRPTPLPDRRPGKRVLQRKKEELDLQRIAATWALARQARRRAA
jgi:hypothetical protein